jgi:hypothetical protein
LGVVVAELVFWSWLTALGCFFRVGRSCSVLNFYGFCQVVQCVGQAFVQKIMAFQKTGISGLGL